ncbi:MULTISPECIES: DUF928 domain-containing protein [Pseudanabaena]|uniref:DUF928 domain-containing protein n=1 Tax=Pseudanabaena TaxID=1152 RepID=UPI002478A587|nr:MULTISPECIES: DUF928 domain-containing protein [Pseudanabaena]MEA5488341.1 DUF928 domain-containing protein [Pseudanabaena sp. CCNP1317]WGS72835.1 DUF928 domain-containing protein [Pseudanabaena galeata CCNP1313]
MKLYIWRSLFQYPKLVLVTILLSAVSWCAPILGQSKSISSYGLGIVQSSSQREQIRCADLTNLVSIDLLAPDDGARTLSERPTFYWYIEHKSLASKNSTQVGYSNNFYVDFFVRDGFARNAKSIFRSRSEVTPKVKSGLYRFELPAKAPALEVNKTYSWHIRYMQLSGHDQSDVTNQIDIRAIVKRESNPSVIKKVQAASTHLEKARIFAKNLYWYDALDAYTKWIDVNPNDKEALQERLAMLDQLMERYPKKKCIGKYNVNNSSLINSKQSIPQIMKYSPSR